MELEVAGSYVCTRRGGFQHHVDGNVCHYDVAGIRRHVRRALLAHPRHGIVLEMHRLLVVVVVVVGVLARRNEMSTWRWAADRACQTPLERRRLPSQKTCDVRGGIIEIDAATMSPGECGRGTEEGRHDERTNEEEDEEYIIFHARQTRM